MRKRISERNKFPNADLFSEYKKIEYLFSENKCISTLNRWGDGLPPEFTLEQYLNDLAFNAWNLRGTAISFYNMREELGLSKDKINANFNNDVFVDFIELCMNCIYRINKTINTHANILLSDKALLINIIENCKQVLVKLGYGCDLDNETGEIFVYAKNNIATAVAENHEDIAGSLVEYRRYDIKGNIKRKGEILCTLFKKLESVEKKFRGTTYEKLINDTTFLFNKTGIRHWVEQDRIASKTFEKMEQGLLESWYDKTYDLFLSCMVISSYLDIKKEIEEIKKVEDGE